MRSALAGFAALLMTSCAAEAEQPAASEAIASTAPALELTGRVVDRADIIGAEAEQRLTARLAAIESETGVQLVIATTPDLAGRAIDAYSFDLANAWGIGDANRDDGLLLLVAPNERQVRIDVGSGLEASVRDEEAASIIYEAILPEFRKGDFESGIANGVERLAIEVAPAAAKEAA